MANGDPLRVGITQPPDNRATSATMLVHTGSAFGTQHTAFWVQRVGSPRCNAAIRGDNNSTGSQPSGVIPTGVMGATPAASAGIGVLGAATGQSNLFFGETGVLGVTSSFGVVGRALTGLIVDEPGTFVSATGVVGECGAGVGVHGIATSGWGIIGQSVGRAGVTGTSVNGAGVEARSDQSTGVLANSQSGVGLEAFSSNGLAGVRGQSTRMYGVIGTSAQGVGVIGISPTNAVQGRSTGSAGASIGVSGFCAAGAGVQGDSTTGIGVAGRSPRGWAGYFEGNVIVRGGFYVVGGPKSAAVKHPDGSHRSLFCTESTESYFEDFGEVSLTGDSVSVKLDKDFAGLVKRDSYQVFLTSYGPQAVYVRSRTRAGFEIARVDRGSDRRVSMRVGYRIVARRADVKSVRLPRIKIPTRAADVNSPEQAPSTRKRSGSLTAIAQLEPLPGTPKLPSPNLRVLGKVKPLRSRRK